MKIDDIAKQLANKVNQEHYIKHYLERVQRGAYKKGVKDTEEKQLSLCSVSDSFFCDAKLVNGISNCKKQCEGCLKCLHTPKK